MGPICIMGASVPAGRAAELSAFVGNEQMKFDIEPVNDVQGMPRYVTMISYKLNCKEDGFVSPIVIVEPVRVAVLTMGVTVELNE